MSVNNRESLLRVAFTGGATGGHIYPNLAVAAALRELKPDTKLYYYGRPDKLEAELLKNPELKDDKGLSYGSYIEFVPVNGKSLPSGANPLKYISWSLEFMAEVVRVKRELESREINVVFGTGGYVAGPVFTAAQQLAIPYIIHNLDAHLGLANKVFLDKAKYIGLAFPLAGIDQKRSRLIGNPVSSKFFMPRASERLTNTGMREIHILITGGSQGAEAINDLIGTMLLDLKQLTGETLKLQIKHVTGKANYEKFILNHLDGQAHRYEELFFHYEVIPYAHNMPELCNWADIAICRSGAMTIAEMAAAQVVPIFLPLPWAANDHQTKNASYLVKAGAAYSFNQRELGLGGTETALREALMDLITKPEHLATMRASLKSFANPNAARQLAELIVMASQ